MKDSNELKLCAIDRRKFIKNSAMATAVITLSPFLPACETSGKKPNIVYVFADNWRGSATDETKHRLSWQLKSDERGQKQTAFHLIVASSPEKLDKSTGDWVMVVEPVVADVPCTAQTCNGNTDFDVITPRTLEMMDKETILVDFGTNLTGMMKMNFRNLTPIWMDGRKRRNGVLEIRGSLLQCMDNGMNLFRQAPRKRHLKMYLNYHAFRYVLIEGLPYLPSSEDMTAVAIETEVDETGSFRCSNELYNRIHTMVRCTYRCLNLGEQTVDCPHRERLGYGDGQTIMDLGCYNFDAVPMYAKWSHNWWDEQEEDGFVPFTAPCPHKTGGGPAWGAMCIMVPCKTYLFSNDRRLLEEGYPVMKKYIDYLNAHSEQGVLQDIFPGEKY